MGKYQQLYLALIIYTKKKTDMIMKNQKLRMPFLECAGFNKQVKW